MKKKIVVLITLFILLIIKQNPIIVQANDNLNGIKTDKKVSDRLIIKYKKANDNIAINNDISSKVKSVTNINNKLSVIELDNANDKNEVYNELKNNPNIDKIENDHVLNINQIPNDPHYDDQWDISNIDAENIWSYNLVSQKTVTVAVIDSGIDYNHEDLKGITADGGYNFYDDNSNYLDDNGHGTKVSGIIAANSNNNIGIAGLNANLPVKILPLKVSDSSGEALGSDIIRAIDYAIKQKVDVINISMGGDEYFDLEDQEIQKAISSGIIIVASAGNDGNSGYSYPASYDNVLSIGSVDENNEKSSFSNFNDKIKLCAPGEDIASTNSYGKYSYCSGTSFSSPIVAALAADMKSLRPDMTNKEIIDTMKIDANDLGTAGRDDNYGYGEVDFSKSIKDILSPKSINLQATNLDLNEKQTKKIIATISPSNTLDNKIFWTSSNENIATVDSEGNVTGVSYGAVTITAKTEQGGLIATSSVNVLDPNSISVNYQSQVQNVGWQEWKNAGELSGTQGQGLRVEALKINLINAPVGATIKYQVHIQKIGWQDWVSNGDIAGTVGKSLRIEAIRIVLENAPGYSIAYQTHVQNIGWEDWSYDGAISGTAGKGLRIEGLKIKVIKNN